MNLKTILFASIVIFLQTRTCVLAETLRISILVLDDQGKPVEGAEVRARYLETVRQEGKDVRVPMELASPQTTDANGQCELVPRDVSWSLAAICAFRVETTTDEAMNLYDNAPRDPQERKRFEREVDDRLRGYSTAYQQLTPDKAIKRSITLKMEKAIKVTGRVQVGGRPLARAFVTINSRKTPIDQLFPRSSPELTDQVGSFSFYSIPGELDQARIVVERAGGNRVLNLNHVPSEPTPVGLNFEFDTEAKNFELANEY